MKIKDILGEDGVTVAAVSGDKAKLSNGQEVDAKTLAPDTKHPGQYTMPEMDPTAIKPGAVVSTGDETTSEEYENDLVSQGNQDVGGDATDNFIDQTRDQGYERAQSITRESEDLTAMLRIAGLR
jgi:hypothetical protein